MTGIIKETDICPVCQFEGQFNRVIHRNVGDVRSTIQKFCQNCGSMLKHLNGVY